MQKKPLRRIGTMKRAVLGAADSQKLDAAEYVP
jgi:hypothetical protein